MKHDSNQQPEGGGGGMRKQTIYQRGQAVGKCTFLEYRGYQVRSNGKRMRKALFLCQCGKEFEAVVYKVASEHTKSCGCRLKHGLSDHPLYSTWAIMKGRCFNPNDQAYDRYGGRGITIHKPWVDDFKSFLDYVSSLSGYNGPGMTLDRINNELDYMPKNLRWGTKHEQSANQRIRRTNTSGYTGVSFDKSRNKWRATIKVNRKRVWLGHHKSAEAAATARNEYILQNGLTEYPLAIIK